MSAGENFSCSYSPAGFTASRRSSSPAAICPADTPSEYSSYRRSPDGAAYTPRPPEWRMRRSGHRTHWDNAVRARCGRAPCTRRRTAPKCGRRILRSIKSVLIIQYDLLIPRDIERLRQRSAAGIVRALAPRGDARKSVCPDREKRLRVDPVCFNGSPPLVRQGVEGQDIVTAIRGDQVAAEEGAVVLRHPGSAEKAM